MLTKADLDAGTVDSFEFHAQFVTKLVLLEIVKHVPPSLLCEAGAEFEGIPDEHWAKCHFINAENKSKIVDAGVALDAETNKQIGISAGHILLGIAQQIIQGRIKGVDDVVTFIDSLETLQLVSRDDLSPAQLAAFEKASATGDALPVHHEGDPFAGMSNTVH
jgi:hypothetical protein